MKKTLILVQALIVGSVLYAQTPEPVPAAYAFPLKQTFVRLWQPVSPITNSSLVPGKPVEEVLTSTQYFDGLGRKLQSVEKQISPQKKDQVKGIVYDEYGREAYSYLPFIATGSSVDDGEFKYNPFQQQEAFMNQRFPLNAETFFYGQTMYEASPVNRVKKVLPEGSSWVGSNRGISTQYLNNTLADDIKTWAVNSGLPVMNGVYAAGTLTKVVKTDEHNIQTIEFTDIEDKVILQKVQLTANPQNGYSDWLCTYYVYDAYEQLRFVLQPQAVSKLSSPGINWVVSAGILEELCFSYDYDSKGRLISKKIPGAGVQLMVYDSRDRLIMSQDGNLRAANKWMVTKYDLLSRPYINGLWTSADNRDFHASQAWNSTAYPVTTTGFELLTESYYDNYNWVAGTGSLLSATIDATNLNNSNYFITTYDNSPLFALPLVADYGTRGKLTGSKTRILNTNQFLYTVTFYDKDGRVIQSQNMNIAGGKDIKTLQYDFSGKVLRSFVQHQLPGSNPQSHTILTKVNYDHGGRILNVKKTISSTINGTTLAIAEKTIVENSYDELSFLKSKKVGTKPGTSAELESLTYDYNIRGWLLGANRDYAKDAHNNNYFGFDLGYDKAANGIIGNQLYANPQYTGNIEGMVWKSRGDGEKRKYDFTYDAADRLREADFNQYTGGNFNKTAQVDFSVNGLAYDANGNILSINKKGLLLTSSNYIDQLSYNYYDGGNKLKNVIDGSNDPNTKLGDFRTSILHPDAGAKTSSTIDYTYDANGNLEKDLNKDIGTANSGGIIYNHLNLPQSITLRKAGLGNPAKGMITYLYDAAGNKLKKETLEYDVNSKAVTSTTTYIDGFIYESKATSPANNPSDDYTDVLQFISHEEGRIRFKPGVSGTPPSFEYDYFIKDHLGNVRMVLTEEQRQDVYPAATLENTTYNGGTAVSVENGYYTIDAGNIKTKSAAHIQTDYTNNNGNPPYNNNPYSNTAANSDKVYQLNANNNRTGLGIVLKVMSGDKVNVFGKSYYETPIGGYTNSTNPLYVSDILGAFTSNSIIAGKGVTAGQIAATPNFPVSVLGLLGNQPNQTASTPRASINWIILDEQFKYVGGGFDATGNSGTIKEHNLATLPTIDIPKNGYIYVYCSNESQYNVFFDNLQLIHTRGSILEETHYYPFGLVMAGISSKAAGKMGNDKKYNGKYLERNEFADGNGLEWYDYGFREYDAQISRFFRVDPISEQFYYLTPYQYASNDPVGNVDIDGLEGANFQAAWNWLFKKTLDNPTGKAAYVSAALVGVGQSLKKTVDGLAYAVTNPGKTIVGIAKLTTSTGQAELSIQMAKGLNKKLDDFKNGDNLERTVMTSEFIMDALQAIFTTKGVGAFTKVGTASKVATATKVAKAGSNIALGVRENLVGFAKRVGGSTWEAWGSKNFQAQFLETINNPANKIHFNLDGVGNVWKAVSDGAKGFGKSQHVTSWELHQIYSNPDVLKRTTFYQGGKVVPNPF